MVDETIQRKYCSLEEAEKLLPKVEMTLQKLQSLNKILELLDTVEIEVDEHSPHVREVTRFNKVFHKLSYEFYELLDELELSGVILKDLNNGLVDFWHKFEGRDVHLCWRQGEESIQHWHEIESGFAGRKKIIDLEKKM